MFGIVAMMLSIGAGMLAVWAIGATIAPKLDLIVTLLRHGPQPMHLDRDPSPVQALPRVTRRAASYRPQPTAAAWRAAA